LVGSAKKVSAFLRKGAVLVKGLLVDVAAKNTGSGEWGVVWQHQHSVCLANNPYLYFFSRLVVALSLA
jgi:hypothetical protein